MHNQVQASSLTRSSLRVDKEQISLSHTDHFEIVVWPLICCASPAHAPLSAVSRLSREIQTSQCYS